MKVQEPGKVYLAPLMEKFKNLREERGKDDLALPVLVKNNLSDLLRVWPIDRSCWTL